MKEVADDINEARRGAESLSRLYDLTTKIDDLDDLVASLSLFLSLLPLYLPPSRHASYPIPLLPLPFALMLILSFKESLILPTRRLEMEGELKERPNKSRYYFLFNGIPFFILLLSHRYFCSPPPPSCLLISLIFIFSQLILLSFVFFFPLADMMMCTKHKVLRT